MMRMARPGPGERLAPHDALGQAELLADGADLVLEQPAQRLDQLEVHLLGEAAHVVVTLDLGGLPRAALDDVAVERALHEELGVDELARLLLEAADELLADDLAFVLGLGDAGELVEKAVARVHGDERDAERAREGLDHTFGLAHAHHALIDEHAGEARADGLVHEQRGDRRIDAPREPQDGLVVADLQRGSA